VNLDSGHVPICNHFTAFDVNAQVRPDLTPDRADVERSQSRMFRARGDEGDQFVARWHTEIAVFEVSEGQLS